MLFNKPSREKALINGSSMADIAFLLLIFFLVTTTINVDTGIGLILPPPNEQEAEIKERNLMNILINADGLVSVDDKQVPIDQIKSILKKFITNRGKEDHLSESPQKAVISLKTHRETPYKIYIDMLDEVMGTYKELRNEAAIQNFGIKFDGLKPGSKERDLIISIYPKKISVADPTE